MSYEDVKSILAGMKKDKKTYIRCNTLKGGVKHIKDVLEKRELQLMLSLTYHMHMKYQDMII